MHLVVDAMCGRDVDFVTTYGKVISETTTNVHELVESTKTFVLSATHAESAGAISNDLAKATGLPSKLCDAVSVAIEGRSAEIEKAVIRQITTGFSNRYLADFDWSLRLALSSENVSKLRETVLILTLYVNDLNGGKREHVMELTKETCGKLLSDFASINKCVQSVSFEKQG